MSEDNEDFRLKIDPSKPEYDIEEWPFFHLTRVISLYHMKMDAALKPVGMDVSRWRVLNILAVNKFATITKIAGDAVMRMPTMAKIIQRMVNEDLVTTREAAADGRSTEVSLTDNGRQMLLLAKAKGSVIAQQAFMNISDDELKALNEICRKIYGNLSP
ncbi:MULTISPECIES: MarR family winged helix-turn-helix transcriptional regulator [Ensifer]|uniref:MarR family winged helix-turn-helix transcriptional regulator n=1 Tax=Ensifer TaxID=106591 RepID=UPI00046CDDCB|nr:MULTISPECIES: MarR family winged helix-turn-helix transcriptional regulator [Ensifer]KQY72519.1 hypothetical protein ASD52_29865 [Ensifer sp. Root142]MBD9489440.1 winged helix-turn-helix transcriptional regulator [Ensifer sp. ENS11]MDP9632725.1 DNA-binding MarR family transcriptional regulator [Ensifer adhaerens]NOV17754.1 MarR family transcriptional regulator [Ensifer canadensis]